MSAGLLGSQIQISITVIMKSNRRQPRRSKPIGGGSDSDSSFYQQLSSDPTDDEATIITSNLLRAAASRYEQREHRQPQHTKHKVDKKRAPKVAALIFVVFFLLSGSHFTIQNIRELLASGADNDGETARNSTGIGIMVWEVGEGNNNTKNIDGGNSMIGDWKQSSLDDIVKEMSQPNLDSNGNPIQMPLELSNLADMTTPLDPMHETAIFWHVPRSAGTTVKEVATYCFDLTLASEIGVMIDPNAATADQIMTVVDANTGAKFLNVDTTSPEGLERARNFNLASYPDLDLIATPYIFMASGALFSSVDRGRLIVFFRHPVDRAVSMYYYLRDKAGIRGAQIGDTIDLYAKSSMVENNWMTRFLTGKMGGELTPDDEALAKEILRTKSLVGLLSKKAESMRRFKQYFNWKSNYDNDKMFGQECEDKLLHWAWSGKNKHKSLTEGSDTWNLLKEQNTFDIRLYEYAMKLFEVQALLFSSQ